MTSPPLSRLVSCAPKAEPGSGLYPRIGAALGVRVDDAGDMARAIIVGELTKRVAAAEKPK